MVTFTLPSEMSADMLGLIPEQQAKVGELFIKEKLMSYSLAMDRSRLWVLFVADSESELISLIDQLPMTSYLDYDYHELMFHNSVQLVPSMSLN